MTDTGSLVRPVREPSGVLAVAPPAELDVCAGGIDRAREAALRGPQAPAGPAFGSVYACLRRHAEQRPDAACVITDQEVSSYRQVLALTDSISTRLRDAGCRAGDPVAVAVPRGTLSVACLVAVESLGAVYVPLDADWPDERQQAVLCSSNCAYLVVAEAPKSQTSLVRAAKAVGAGVVTAPARPDQHRVQPPARTAEPSEPRYVIHTSGSSGVPKGVVVTQLGMANSVAAMVDSLALQPTDVVAFTAPASYVVSVWQLTSALVAGAAVAVVDEGSVSFPRRLLGVVHRSGVTVLQLVPASLSALVASASAAMLAERLAGLRVLISTGAPISLALLQQVRDLLPAVTMLNAYGATECSDDVAHQVYRPGDELDGGQRFAPAGRPLPGTSAYVLTHRAEGWDAAGAGEVGELFVGGRPVAAGYLRAGEHRTGAFYRDPFDAGSPTGRLYRTGDLAVVRNGAIDCLGRRDRQVKVRGMRLELDEVEVAAMRLAGVARAAALVAGDRLRIFFESDTVSTEAMRGQLRRTLPRGLVPSEVVRLLALPRTISGKTDYERLRARTEAGGT
jgi:amino acid adenylation domain-containing protein